MKSLKWENIKNKDGGEVMHLLITIIIITTLAITIAYSLAKSFDKSSVKITTKISEKTLNAINGALSEKNQKIEQDELTTNDLPK